ncbi:long-chain fatty acid--CoA ligase [Mumia sp. zg.B53]|uniref:AMP-dependent synthetase/ligase n=1 Tax=unclassified Mumia TaxID=2621872 RepID=UPI001C6E7571|nr:MULTISPECIES: long-chain fatty acid--CoA ligase [unclassified Mumia]MBW9211266.1 long-chain fatty acid--CoA ligase [Mumia sp. zg.B21]MBW9215841.1 long-chain fatty acid--CoA ligase [Mumia sp. zg.B53]MDD9349708.1 long-chain fatty acid--CoA ligase [Mumia sp.]
MANAPTPEHLEIVESRAKNVGEMFFARVRETPTREAYRYPVGENWRSLTWGETGDVVSRIAAGLVSLGIKPEERVAIASGTRYEWILADLAIMAAGAATTTVYPTTVTDDVAYILADSGSRIVFAEDAVQLAKLQDKRSELPDVIKVVLFDGDHDSDWVITLSDLEQLGDKLLAEQPSVVEERVAAISPDQLATLIYTSGTTGRPKGVRLTHDSWTYEGAAVAAGGYITIDDLQYLWLPMAHSFGKVLLSTQLQIGFPTAVDGAIPKIVDNLAVVKPTFMGAAPRIFEKAYGRIVGMMEEEGGAKLKLFRWATKVAAQVKALEREGKKVPAGLAFQHRLADKIVLSKVRDRFGGRVRFFISGASALSQEVAEWFEAAGILILEGYGLTESAAGSFVNHPDQYKLGTVGLPMPGTEVKIAEDGEILIKGPGVMQGYHNLETESASTVTDDGWLATGDIGQIDEDGFLRITDRKKDLFKTSGGKYVAPSHVEGVFKGVCPLASQMVVHGNNRNFVSALITIDPDAATLFAENHGLAGKSYAEIVTSPQMHKAIEGYVEELNSKLNRWETIKKWQILDRDLSVEEGEMTPSLKLKRKFVEDKYRPILDEFYAGT